jgi:fructuronate reductase
MVRLNRKSLGQVEEWRRAGIALPGFDVAAVARQTRESPTWVHFGAGNIFRGFLAVLQQELLERKLVETGIVAVESYDPELVDRMLRPYDDLALVVTMNADGTFGKRVVGSIGESLVGEPARRADWERLEVIFAARSLQLVSFTITEKGYRLVGLSGELLPEVAQDMEEGPAQPRSAMGRVAALVYERYRSGKHPLALVSMDNCSHNGDKLHDALEAVARAWSDKGRVEKGFVEYLNDRRAVSFPWSMIDKITPRPSEGVKKELERLGFESTETIRTARDTFIAPFVNVEQSQYLVIEDAFPAGRPPLESVGVLFADRPTVDKVERMKVSTCLNPLHTALAVFGCLLGYKSIAEEMKNPKLKKLVTKIGHQEGLPVVVDPGIIRPGDFIREVIEVRFSNPNIPDTPQRIASDTSQKVGPRFGETIKAYRQRPDLDPASLTFIPLAIAAWCRYLMGLDDQGREMTLSPDPMLTELTGHLKGVRMGDPSSAQGKLRPILGNARIFGLDLYQVGLGAKIEGFFFEMIAGPGAVAATLERCVGQEADR